MTTISDRILASAQKNVRADAEPHIELVDHMGDDLAIANAARVSFGKRSTYLLWCRNCSKEISESQLTGTSPRHLLGVAHSCPGDQGAQFHDEYFVERKLRDADRGLIRYLMRERHGTPFEMVQFEFRVGCSIRVMREWQRHRIGSFNEMSTRYVEMEPVFYVPGEDHVRVQVGKPGHYTMQPADKDQSMVARLTMLAAYERAWESYQALIEQGIAKEVAAFVLPLGLYSEQIWSVNLRSAFNFLSLRNAGTALREIMDAAVLVEAAVREFTPVAFEAFEENGRHAP